MKHVARLQFVDHGPVSMLGSFDAFDRVMKMRVEFLAHRFDLRDTVFRERVPELTADQFESFHIFGRSGIS